MSKSKVNFGQRMWVIRRAKAQEIKMKADKEAKDKALLDQFPPSLPLEQPITASISLKPLVVTAPVPAKGMELNVVPQTALDIAINKLREQARKLP